MFTSHRCRWVFAAFLVLLSVFRFWYASTHGLVEDEAYYWLWARHPAPGYYDQGPGVAIAIRFGLLFGNSTGAVRLAAVLCAIAISVTGYSLASRIFRTETAGLLAGILLNVVPLLFVGGILITHDTPQMATWALAVYALARACCVGDPPDAVSSNGSSGNGALTSSTASWAGWWILAGMFAGFSMDCKFTAVLFLPCTLLFLLTWQGGRAALRTPWPYLAVLLALVIFIPPVYWNATHDWASARHILKLGGSQQHQLLNPGWAADFLASQLAVTLLFFFSLIGGAIGAWRIGRRQQDAGLLLAASFSGPILLLFLVLSFHNQVEANWPVPAYFTAVVVTPWLAVNQIKASSRGKAAVLILSHCLSIALAVFGITILLFPQSALLLGQKTADSLRSKDRTNEMYGWPELAAALEQAGWKPGGALRVGTLRYQDAAELSFVLPGQPFVYNLPMLRRHNQFDFWSPMPARSSALVLAPIVRPGDPAEILGELRALFQRIDVLRIVPVWRNPPYTRPIATFILVRGAGYRGGREGQMSKSW